jgi:virginiamycin B lyase
MATSSDRARPPYTFIAERAVATLTIPGAVDFLAVDGETVWATNIDRIERLERGSATPIATVPVPTPCGVMAVDFGAVWVASCHAGALCRVDRRALSVVASVPTGLADPQGELSIATGAGSVWVLSERAGVLTRVDPRSNAVVAQIAVEPESYAAAFGFDAVWITNTGGPGANASGTAQRIDPHTNQVVATIAVGPSPRFLAVGAGAVWTLNQGDGTVSRIDPTTNRVSATIPVAGAAGSGGDIAVGAGRVWVRTTQTLLSVIDPRANTVTETYGPPAGSGAVRVTGDWVWITAHDIQTVWVLPV